MTYDVTIYDDGSKLADIEHYLKKSRVKFKTERNENDFGVHGVEFLGYIITLHTLDERIVDSLSKIFVDAFITVRKINLKKFYSIRWKRRKAPSCKPVKYFCDCQENIPIPF